MESHYNDPNRVEDWIASLSCFVTDCYLLTLIVDDVI
jgi:hypothetical protein